MQYQIQRIEELKRLAEEAYDRDRMASVVELLQRYLEYFPNDSKAWFLYGDAQRVIGRMGAAAVSLGNAERLCPPEHAWTIQGRLGVLFHDRGDYCAAERWYGKALEAKEAQQASWLWVFRGVNFAKQELLSEAENCHRRAIAVNEKDEEAYLNLAMVCRAKAKYNEARSAVETALALCSDYPAAREVLSSLDGVCESHELANRVVRSDSD